MCERHHQGSNDALEDHGDGGRDAKRPRPDQVHSEEAQSDDGSEGWECVGDAWKELQEERRRSFVPRRRLHQHIQKAVEAVLPKNETELTSYLYSIGSDIMLHKDYQSASKILMDAHHHSFINQSWEDIIRHTPDSFHDAQPYVPIAESLEWFYKIMAHNNIDANAFVHDAVAVVNKQKPKKNCLMLQGKPNSGKTLVAESIANSTVYYETLSTFNGTSNFEFQSMLFKRVCLLNEPKITDKTIEIIKCILEGIPVSIDAKYKTGQTLPRTPILIASNEDLTFYTTSRHTNQQALEARTFKYTFHPFEELKHCNGKLHPLMWRTLIAQLDHI